MTAFCSSTALSKREKLEDDVERPLKEFETCVVIHSNDLASGGRRPKKRLKTIFNFEIPFSRGSGCGSVGRAVASNSRDPRFESSHWQKFIYILNN